MQRYKNIEKLLKLNSMFFTKVYFFIELHKCQSISQG